MKIDVRVERIPRYCGCGFAVCGMRFAVAVAVAVAVQIGKNEKPQEKPQTR